MIHWNAGVILFGIAMILLILGFTEGLKDRHDYERRFL